jgi:hypothetical protein
VSTPEDAPRRLTPTERLHEVTMAFAQRAASPPEHSVTITRNAKGVAQFEATIRGTDWQDVLKNARSAYDDLSTAYPYSVNGGNE